MATAPAAALQGGDAQVNATILRAILDGGSGPCTDVVVLNAAAAITAGGLAANLAEGVDMARASLSSGQAKQSLTRLIKVSNG